MTVLQNIGYIRSFMASYGYPAGAMAEFERLQKRAESDPAFGVPLENLVLAYGREKKLRIRETETALQGLAYACGENEYSVELLFLLNCMPILQERFREAGYSDGLFHDSASDLLGKLYECISYKGVYGTFVFDWLAEMLRAERFRIGRFQYEYIDCSGDPEIRLSDGTVLPAGCRKLSLHIPSLGGPLTREVRQESYRLAYDFFKNGFPDGRMVVKTYSWLLYPRHAEFLPENSNILDFSRDFRVYEWQETEGCFTEAWRIYGRDADLPPERLPRKTSLQRAYADWLARGNAGGWGIGVFAYDGKRFYR